MNENNKIIERILQDAKDKCDDILARAQAQKTEMLSSNKLRLDGIREKLESDCQRQGSAMIDNALANSKLDLKKLRLKKKRELLDEVYTEAYRRTLSLPSDKYLALIERLLKAYASKDEVVDIAKKDVKLINAQFLDKLKLGLKLGKVCDIEGGIILRGEGYDKDLSISSLFEAIKEDSEIEIAEALFI